MSDLLKELQREWSEDSPIDKTKLDDEALRVPYLHSKWTGHLNVMRKLVRKKQFELEKLTHLKKEHLGGYLSPEKVNELGWDHNPFNGRIKPMKGELKDWVSVDDDVATVREELQELTDIRDFVIDVVEAIKWRHTHIRNAIDWARFMAGG